MVGKTGVPTHRHSQVSRGRTLTIGNQSTETGYGGAIARLMGMSDATWERHANPWSVWTRVPIMPLLALAIFSRAWIGWWSLVPITLLVLWTWINTRAFPPPATMSSWAARGTLGERLWLARRGTPIPAHHERVATVLSVLMGVGTIILAYGIIVLDGWATIAGLAITFGAKMWFVDRMVWLHDEMEGVR